MSLESSFLWGSPHPSLSSPPAACPWHPRLCGVSPPLLLHCWLRVQSWVAQEPISNECKQQASTGQMLVVLDRNPKPHFFKWNPTFTCWLLKNKTDQNTRVAWWGFSSETALPWASALHPDPAVTPSLPEPIEDSRMLIRNFTNLWQIRFLQKLFHM